MQTEVRAATRRSFQLGCRLMAARPLPSSRLRRRPIRSLPIRRGKHRLRCPHPPSFRRFLRQRQAIDSRWRAVISHALPVQVEVIVPVSAALYRAMYLRHRAAVGPPPSEWRGLRRPEFRSSVFFPVPLPTVREKPSAHSTLKDLRGGRLKRFFSASWNMSAPRAVRWTRESRGTLSSRQSLI